MGLTFATPNGGNSKLTGNKNKNNNKKAKTKTSSYTAPSGHPSANTTPKSQTKVVTTKNTASSGGGHPGALATVTPKYGTSLASPIASTAKTTPLASANITKASNTTKPETVVSTAITPKAEPANHPSQIVNAVLPQTNNKADQNTAAAKALITQAEGRATAEAASEAKAEAASEAYHKANPGMREAQDSMTGLIFNEGYDKKFDFNGDGILDLSDLISLSKDGLDKSNAKVTATNKATAEKEAAAKALITQAEAKFKSDKIAADKVISDKVIADKVIADKVIADKVIADKILSDKVASDKADQEAAAAKAIITQAEAKAKADKVIADKVISDKVIADKAIADENAAIEAESQRLLAESKELTALTEKKASILLDKTTESTPLPNTPPPGTATEVVTPNTPPPGTPTTPKVVTPPTKVVTPKVVTPPNTPPPGTPTTEVVASSVPADHPSEKVIAELPEEEVKADSNRSILFDPTSRDKFVNDKSKGTVEGKAAAVAEADKNATKERINLSEDNETVAEVPKYDQEYWAGKLAKGKADGNENIQADLKTEQDSIGINKAYSGDTVVTEDMTRKANDDLSRVTGSMAVLDDPKMTTEEKADLTKAGILVGGVTKTEEKSGLLGEKLDTTYDYKGGPSIVTKATDPTIKGVRLGDKTSTTFVDGVEVATKTGNDPLGYDAEVTKPDISGYIDDTQAVDPVQANEEITSVNEQIKTETDPIKLKALHQRRLRLMRMMRTNTKFAGLLDDANTKRSNLMSIS